MSDQSSQAGSELPTDPQQRREAIAQALLQILVENQSASNPSPPASSLYLSNDYREMLADFVQICNQEIAALQQGVAALEYLRDHMSHQE